MKYSYPAIFEPDEGGFFVTFPDSSSSTTCGNDLKHAIEMATDSLSLTLWSLEERGEKIPPATPIQAVKLKSNQVVRMIEVDTEEYAKEVAKIKAEEEAMKAENPIKYAREEAGLSLKELAELIGAPYATVQDWNNGRRKPPKWLQRIIVKMIENDDY